METAPLGLLLSATVCLALALIWSLLALRAARARAAESEQQWQASEARWTRLLEGAGDGVWEWNASTSQARYSPRWKAMLGYAPPDLPDTPEQWEQRLHPDDRERVQRAFGRLVTGRTDKYLIEYRLRCKDGSYLWIEDFGIVITHTADGRPERIVGTHTDATAKREAAERLRNSEQMYRSLFDSNPEALWVYDLETLKFTAVNQTALDRYGYSREEFLSLTILDIRPPEEVPRIKAWISQVVSQSPGFVSAGTWLHRRRNGEVFKVDVMGHRLSVDGRPAGLTLSRDLTAQLNAERALRESEGTLRAIFEQAGVGVALTCSHSLALLRTNRKYTELLGYEPGDAPLVNVQSLTHPDDLQEDLRQMERLKRGEIRSFSLTKRLRRKDGRYIWTQVTISPMWAGDEEPSSHIAVIEDITARLQSDELRRALAERLEIAIRISGIGVFEWDLIGAQHECNDKALEILGLSRATFLPVDADPARAAFERVHPDDQARVHSFYRGMLSGRLDQGGLVCRIVRPDGQPRDLQYYLTMQRDASGRAIRAVGVILDVTERLRYEQSERGRLAAEIASRAKSEFLSRMSHELRTPLNAMLGFTQLMLRNQREPLSPAQRDTMGNIERAGWHLLDMINEMLNLARIESGRLTLEMTSVRLDAEVGACLALLTPMAQEHQVNLHWRSPPEPGTWVRADATRLRQVLSNLVSNAIKYNRRGGRVWISVRTAGPQVELHITDEGEGISPEQAAHLFEPFNRLGAEQSKVEGLGLGLVITRSLVELMQGQLRLDSRPGQGSTFIASLPAASAPAPLTDQPGALPAVAGIRPADSARVLYIEDNASNVALVRHIVALRPGIELLVAADGGSGLAMALAHSPDLILLDLNLPDLDGREVFRQLRDDPRTGSIPCVALSADATASRIASMRADGFVDYWTKPIDVAQFLRGLDQLLAPVNS